LIEPGPLIAGFDLYLEAKNYMTEIFTISLVSVVNWWLQPPPVKKTRNWAIWKSGQIAVGARSPPHRGGAYARHRLEKADKHTFYNLRMCFCTKI